MADLNPAIEFAEQTQKFRQELTNKAASYAAEGFAQGDQYFWIPALSRHRGVAHFYLEEYNTGDFGNDLEYCGDVIGAAIDLYPTLLAESVRAHPVYSEEDRKLQLNYHTIYFLQVLTLDRGTTAGLMVHDQNDVGILGSLPTHVNRNLLRIWQAKYASPQDELVQDLIAALSGGEDVVRIDASIKQKLADTIRKFYRKYPQAMNLQAHGAKIPKTIANHQP
jgi:coproporphyrinogen III oxidase